MAKINVKGLTIQDIINLDFNRDIATLSRDDLAKVTSRLVSASNKRIRRLQKTDIGRLSPALKSRMERGGLFSVKGLNRGEVESVFSEARGFLQLKTSSVKGWKDLRHQIATELKVPDEFLNTVTKSKKFWEVYRNATDGKNIPDKTHKNTRWNSDRIREMLSEMFTRKYGFNQRKADMTEELEERIDKLYEEQTGIDEKYDRPASKVEEDEDDGIGGNYDI